MKRTWLIIALAAIISSAIATDSMAGKRLKTFKRVDKNRDGKIQPAEARRAKAIKRKKAVVNKRWEKKADLNNDGVVGPAEARAFFVKIMDVNNDGKVTIAERKAFWLKRRAKVNTPAEKRWDLNNDGFISGEEARKMMDAYLVIVQTKAKVKVDTEIEKEFDINNDGWIDANEAEALMETLKQE